MLSGIEGTKDGHPSVSGILVASDLDPSARAGAAFGDKARRGHLLGTSQAAGDFNPTALDQYLVPNSTVPFAASSYTYEAIERPLASVANVTNFFDCRDESHGASVWATLFDCQANGFYYQSSARAWEGTQLPSTNNLYAGSTVTAVDQWGRVLSMRSERDLRRTDDDTCTTITYGNGTPFPSVVTSATVTDCGVRTGSAVTLAATRFLYDGLSFGDVSTGRVTARWVDRYDANGVYLGTYQAGAYLYDAFGEVNVVIASRSQGGAATRTTTITRDAFGATVTNISEAATGVAMALAQKTAASAWPSLGTSTTDPSGVITKVERDSFGRPLRTTVTTGGQSWTVDRLTYDDSVSGRRLIQESFPGSTATGSEAGASDVQRSTTVFDALARVRFTQSELGWNYSGASIVSDFAVRDAMGRVVFMASPFEVGGAFAPDNVARHGTTYVYDVRGRPVRTVEAIGQNAAATDTNLVAKVYVASTQYTYSGGELTIRTQGPDERDPTSSRYGWSNEATRTAAGFELRKVRKDASGTVKDKVELVWDRLGRVVETRRFQTPTSAVASSVWTDAYDSVGNLLRATEPGTARDSTYDEFGNQLETAWMDGTTRRVSRTSYDGFSRVIQRELVSTVAGGSPVTESLDLFHYDVASGDPAQPSVAAALLRGRLSWVEHPGVGNVYYGYDAVGRGDAEVFQYQNVMGVVSQSSESTVGGRLQRLRLTTEATDDSITYSYDSAGRTTRIDDDNGRLFNASRITPLGQYLAVEFGNGVVEEYKYSPTGRRELQSWTASTNSGTYSYANETRDAEGRVIAELHTTPGTLTYLTAAYDGVGRLTSRIQATSMVPQVDTFTYDGLGNLTSRTTPVGATFQYTPSTTDPDRLCRYAAPGSGTACQFTYDGAGNVTQDSATGSTRTIAYDAGQRITSIARGSTSVALTYGPVGRMKTEVSGPSARTVWTFGGMIERRQRPDGVIQIERSIPGPLGTFVSLRSELDSGGSVANREQIYRHGDGRANRFFTRADGKVVQDATYSVFGNVVAGSDDGSFTGSDDLWNGGDELPEVGVTLLGPRAYDPLLGRFLQRDPIAVVRRSSTANPYSFAFSDPVNHSDPTGLTPPECIGSECAPLLDVGTLIGFGLSLDSSQSRRQRPAPRGRGYGTDRIKVNTKAFEMEPHFFQQCKGAECYIPDVVQQWQRGAMEGGLQGAEDFVDGIVKGVPACLKAGISCPSQTIIGSLLHEKNIIDQLAACEDNCAEVLSRILSREAVGFVAGEGVGKAMSGLGKLKGLGAIAGGVRRSAPVNRAGKPYPSVRHPATGEPIPCPGDGLRVVPEGGRAVWGDSQRRIFRKEWDARFGTPEGGWDLYDIHHIRPRKFGGTNVFDNLVPLRRGLEHSEFTRWWTNY